MATRHVRTSSTASHHTRTASTSSEILITETVSSLQRCVFGNIFRSQRQLTRFGVFLTVFILVIYMLDPFGSSESENVIPDPKLKATAAVRSIPEETKPVSEYRATYFEEMGKRFEGKAWPVRADPFHSNNILAPEVKVEAQGSEIKLKEGSADLNAVVEKVRKAAQVVSKCREVPGLSIVIVKEGHLVQIPLGLADVSSGRPVTTETRFLLHSISKTFLGQLLGVLISESARNLTWDTRVADILGPDFKLATEELTREVTLRDLLSHRTGLSSGNLAVRATYPERWTRARLVKHLKHLPPSAPFRKTFLYSNMCSMLTTHVAEMLGGAPWEKLMVDKLLAPLGMLSSQPVTSAAELEGDNFSRLYVPVEGKRTQADSRIFNQGPLAPVSLLSTTATDVAKWLQFNLHQGRLADGRQLIRRDVWVAMWTKQTKLSPMFLAAVDKSGTQWPVKDVSEGYGLFWFINKYRGLRNLWHGGGLYSHYTLAWHFPEKDTALYTVINGYSGDSHPFSVVESLAYYTADLLLGYQPWLDENSLCTFPKLSNYPSSSQNQTKGAAVENKMEEVIKEIQQEEAGENDSEEVSKLLRKKGAENGEFGSERLHFATEAPVQQNHAGDVGVELSQNKDFPDRNRAEIMKEEEQKLSPKKELKSKSHVPILPLKSYEGRYCSPLFGNFSVFLRPPSAQLQCQMNILTGNLRYSQDHTFGVELTKSLRFLSKPSKTAAAKNAFSITFVESSPGEVTAVDVHSSWVMEVPIRFEKLR